MESGLIFALFSFYTPLDSLSLMFIVSEYKIRIKGEKGSNLDYLIKGKLSEILEGLKLSRF